MEIAVQEVVAGMGYYGYLLIMVLPIVQKKEANNIKLIHHSEIKNL